MKVRLKDGPGKCAGRVEIQHKGQWKRVTTDGWTDNNANAVCKKLRCGKERQLTNPEKFSEGSDVFLNNIFSCKSKTSNISECITKDLINTKEMKAIGITCESECSFHLSVYLPFDLLLLCLTIIVQVHTFSNSREVCINALE